MLPSNRTELIEELNATEERYVRKKLALRGFEKWQIPVVTHWLDERSASREEAASKSRMRWFRARIIFSVLVSVAALAWQCRGVLST